MNVRKLHQQFEEDFQRQQAAMGAGFAVTVTITDANGKPQQRTVPASLEHFAKLPKLWCTLLGQAMLRSGKGYRKSSSRRPSYKQFAAEYKAGPFKWSAVREEWQKQRRADKIPKALR